MNNSRSIYYRVDEGLTRWMAANGVLLLRLSLGVGFFWFGVLKFFPELSPAEELAGQTIRVMTFGMLSERTAVLILASWECIIGLGLILGIYLRVVLFLLWLQMLGTTTPLFLFPELCFSGFPYAPTLEGQYILKNIVLVCAGIVIGATIRGGHRRSERSQAE